VKTVFTFLFSHIGILFLVFLAVMFSSRFDITSVIAPVPWIACAGLLLWQSGRLWRALWAAEQSDSRWVSANATHWGS